MCQYIRAAKSKKISRPQKFLVVDSIRINDIAVHIHVQLLARHADALGEEQRGENIKDAVNEK